MSAQGFTTNGRVSCKCRALLCNHTVPFLKYREALHERVGTLPEKHTFLPEQVEISAENIAVFSENLEPLLARVVILPKNRSIL
jgi:hypothetical protein